VCDRTLSIDAPVELVVQNGAGDVVIESGPAGRVRVQGTITVQRGLRRSARGAEELVRRLESDPPITVSDGRVEVGGLGADDARNVSIGYRIIVPSETRISSRTGSGRQQIAGIAAEVSAEADSGGIELRNIGAATSARTGSGSIRADAIAGPITARAGSGSITLRQSAPGDVEVTSGSGTITLRDVSGALRARAGSGSIRVDGTPTDDWDLNTGSGSVRLTLPANLGFVLDARSGSGSVHTDHPVTVEGTQGRNQLRGEVRGGGPTIRVRTGSGSIRLE
jgi:hypothetical protein